MTHVLKVGFAFSANPAFQQQILKIQKRRSFLTAVLIAAI